MTTPANSSGATKAFNAFMESTPAVTKGLSFALVLFTLVSFALGPGVVSLIPAAVWQKQHIQGLILCAFSERSVLGLLIALFWLNRYGKKIEKDVGSKTYGKDFLMSMWIINIIYLYFVSCLCTVKICTPMVTPMQGMFPVMLAMIVKYPQSESINLYGIVKVPTQYFPWVIIAFVALMTNRIPFDLLSAMILAKLQERGCCTFDRSKVIQFMWNCGEKVVNKCCKCLKRSAIQREGYQPVEQDSVTEEDRESRRIAALEAAMSRIERSAATT